MDNPLNTAPCGVHCSLCIAFQREKKKCLGCFAVENSKPHHCRVCRIKNCEHLDKIEIKSCSACSFFPCKRLINLDKRYKLKYGMSSNENIYKLRELPLNVFIDKEIKQWTCFKCGNLLCVHRENCLHCNSKNKFFPIQKK